MHLLGGVQICSTSLAIYLAGCWDIGITWRQFIRDNVPKFVVGPCAQVSSSFGLEQAHKSKTKDQTKLLAWIVTGVSLCPRGSSMSSCEEQYNVTRLLDN